MANQSSYAPQLEKIVQQYNRLTGGFDQARKAIDSDWERLHKVRASVDSAIWSGDSKAVAKALDELVVTMTALESQYLKPVVEAPTDKSYRGLLSSYVVAHTEDSLDKKEVRGYVKTHLPQGKRLNVALIDREMERLGYIVTDRFYTKKPEFPYDTATAAKMARLTTSDVQSYVRFFEKDKDYVIREGRKRFSESGLAKLKEKAKLKAKKKK